MTFNFDVTGIFLCDVQNGPIKNLRFIMLLHANKKAMDCAETFSDTDRVLIRKSQKRFRCCFCCVVYNVGL